MGIGRWKNVFNSAASTLKEKVLKHHDGSSSSSSSLQDAVLSGNIEAVKKQQESGANFAEKDKNGNTLLHLAVMKGHVDLAEYLLDFCDVDERNTEGETALMIVIKNNRGDIFNRLINKNPELLTTTGRTGETILHLAARNGNFVIVKEAVKAGAEIGVADYERNTPLHLAALNGHVKVVSYLIDHLLKHFETEYRGSEYEELAKYVNARNKAGNTPLHLAVLRGRKEAAFALVRLGNADITIKNEENETPLNITDDALFQKDLTILAKTRDLTEEGILINKNVSQELGRYLEVLKQEKQDAEKGRE